MEATAAAATAVTSFFIGSFPTAYVFVRASHGRDLRREGSGNIGALNSFEVTGSKKVGLLVLLTDLVKGAAPVGLANLLFPQEYLLAALALLFVVLGHNYSPWIGWKGGRGLASAAGGALLLNPAFLLYWAGLWLLARVFSRDVHVGNLVATVSAPVLVFLLPGVTDALTRYQDVTVWEHRAASIAVSLLVFLRHLEPLSALLHRNRK
jgi:glycerol-3-phosphate acyltransferase PlsY